MRLINLIFILSVINIMIVKGQIGTSFWFAAPDVSQQHFNNSIPLDLHITSLYTTHVKISRPADPSFTPVEFNLGPQQTQMTRLDALLTVDEIEVYARAASAGNFIQNKGFLIESSPGEITAYYELEGQNNTDIISLKSVNALGKSFRVSTQRKYKNHGYSDDFSGFVVVATADNTVVTVDPNGNNLQFHGTVPFNVTLNKGETFAARAAGQAPAQHIFGIKVTSTKNIAITIFDDSMQIDDGGSNWDIFSDQLVPESLVGYEYIVLKGNVQDTPDNILVPNTLKDGEAIFICPTVNNTNIYVDGVFAGNIPLAGGYFSYVIKNLATHIRADKPVYVNHITGYSTLAAGARELGGAILPTIDGCTGSHSVTVKRTPAAGFVFFNNLMVRNDTVTGSPTKNQAIYNFTYSINGGPPVAINPNHFTYIMGGAFAYYDRTKAGGAAYYNNVVDGQILRVDNPIARFHLGIMQGKQSPGCKYGYFSDYAASAPKVGIGGYTNSPSGIYCNLNPIQLVAAGGTTYKWYAPFNPALIAKLDYDSVAAPYFFPDSTGVFYFNVIVTGECWAKDTLQTKITVNQAASTDFTFSADEGCSPFAPILTNLSDTVVGVEQLWTIVTANSGSYQIDQDTIPRTFPLLLPENHTDTIQTHTVKLVVKGVSHSCPTTKSKDIKVKPEVDAEFDASDTLGCHPLMVNFTNLSTGHIDSTSYYWDFGSNTQSFEKDPSYTYDNYSAGDTNYTAKLTIISPLGCSDSAFQKVYVHPRVRTSLAIDTAYGCSPLQFNLDPSNSVGVDTFFWHIDYWYGDSSFVTTSNAPVHFLHRDTSAVSGPDTLMIDFYGTNQYNCLDTFTQRKIIVYPDAIADFDVSPYDVCDSVPVFFTDKSFGYNLFYDLNFGDGTIYQGNTFGSAYDKMFFNRSDNDSIFNIRLKVISDYYCETTKDTTITVHPFIKANFGLGYNTNCAPLDALFSNLSVRSHFYEWDFGDGSPISFTSAASFIHQYWNYSAIDDTTYTIRLVTRNNEGCSDTLVRQLSLFPQVVSDFNLTAGAFCSPREVIFQNNSTGGLLSYLWQFGNSTSGTNIAPVFTKLYTNLSQKDTTYYVSLTASNPFGCDSTTFDSVMVYASIDADFSMPVSDSCSPFTLRLENLSSTGAKFFEWDFIGSGLPTNTNFEPILPPFTNTSLLADTIPIRLVVFGASDASHKVCADTNTVNMVVYPRVETLFNLDLAADCQPYYSIIHNNTLLRNGTAFQWRLDNNFYSSSADPSPLLIPNLTNNTVPHSLRLTAMTQFGCTDTIDQNFTIYPLVDAKFTIDKSQMCSGDSVFIDRSNTRGGIVNFDWNFNNETNSNRSDATFFHPYTNTASNIPVAKFITLTVNNTQGCDSSWTQSVLVSPQVVADFNFDLPQVCYPHTTGFINNTTNAGFYQWDFDDGSGSTQAAPTHQFNNFDKITDEVYNVKLLARSQYNCYDSTNKNITIWAKPSADFYFPVTVDCPPFNAQMINSSEGAGLTYQWTFNGEGSSTEEDPEFEFSNSKSQIVDKPITLITTSNKNCKDTLMKVLRVYPNVIVDFSSSDTAGCSPMEVEFEGDTLHVSKMYWYIDNKAFSTIKDPTYRFVNEYPEDQTFSIKFKAYSLYNCVDSAEQEIFIYPNPGAEFIPDPLLQIYDTVNDATLVTFNNVTRFQDNWNYEWYYGDGNSDEGNAAENPHVYGDHFWGDPANGSKIPVTLVAWNSNNEECRDTVLHEIVINPPLPQVNLFEDIEACEPFTVDFSAYTKYVFEDQYQWDFGTGGATSVNESPTFTYTKQGVYTAKLLVQGDGGANWDYKIITVYPRPEADFTFNDSVVFDSSQTKGYDDINFYNLTKYGKDYFWYFKSEEIETKDTSFADSKESDPVWHYTELGTYYVGMIARSDIGCLDTIISARPIRVLGEGYLEFPTGFLVDPDMDANEYYSDSKTNNYVFYPKSSGVDEYQLEIYNRWGVLIFMTTDIKRGWDGYINGEPGMQDVYIWRAKGRYTNGQPFDMSGDITLLRKKM